MSQSNQLKSAMLALTQERGLPEFYQSDVEMDVESLDRFNGHKLIWLLRTNGTVLVPIEVGAHTGYIDYWYQAPHGQKVEAYLVDTSKGTIEAIDQATAQELNQRPPCDFPLSGVGDLEAIAGKVNAVLERGCNLKLWGLFDTPTSVESIGGWPEWRDYFSRTGNTVMLTFISKAMSLSSLLQDVSKSRLN